MMVREGLIWSDQRDGVKNKDMVFDFKNNKLILPQLSTYPAEFNDIDNNNDEANIFIWSRHHLSQSVELYWCF